MKNLRIEIKWAVIFVSMSLLWMLLERTTGLHDQHVDKHMTFTNFIAFPAITVYVLALLDKRRNVYAGKMTYKQGIITGFIITLLVTLLSPLTQYITSVFITPQYFPNIINYTVSEGQMTQQAAEDQFNLKNYIIQGLIGAPVMGILTTAIVAIFTRKKHTTHE